MNWTEHGVAEGPCGVRSLEANVDSKYLTSGDYERSMRLCPRDRCVCAGVLSRCAVATLETARFTASQDATIAGSAYDDAVHKACYEIPESGGTVGPLSDGTIIKVEAR